MACGPAEVLCCARGAHPPPSLPAPSGEQLNVCRLRTCAGNKTPCSLCRHSDLVPSGLQETCLPTFSGGRVFSLLGEKWDQTRYLPFPFFRYSRYCSGALRGPGAWAFASRVMLLRLKRRPPKHTSASWRGSARRPWPGAAARRRRLQRGWRPWPRAASAVSHEAGPRLQPHFIGEEVEAQKAGHFVAQISAQGGPSPSLPRASSARMQEEAREGCAVPPGQLCSLPPLGRPARSPVVPPAAPPPRLLPRPQVCLH